MNSEEILKKCEMLEQPLLTEDGFLNPACMSELESAITNMPRTYERLKDDPEWSTPEITHFKQITGAFALWSVRQLQDTAFPPDLEHLIGYLHICLKRDFLKQDNSRWGEMGWGNFSLCQINKMLFDILWEDKIFMAWNTKESLGEDWLDIHALLHNVCLSIREERRQFKASSKKFDEGNEKFSQK